MATDETKVGIRELKAHLSHYVRLAREGARVVVTDRGEEVAELRAVTPAHPGLRELIDSGMVSWSGRQAQDLPHADPRSAASPSPRPSSDARAR